METRYNCTLISERVRDHMSVKGTVAAGHNETVKAAEIILENGGNAFDAVVAAHFAACVCEPILASLSGGGFLMAKRESERPLLYDFFVQTPKRKNLDREIDFYPIEANFGEVTQEFHVGMASVATPGAVKGIFEIHKDLCSMPMKDLVQPAIKLAKQGVTLNPFQSYIFDVISPILTSTKDSQSIFCNGETGNVLQSGDHFVLTEFADLLDALAHEGEALFYQGEIAKTIAQMSQDYPGFISREDLQNYAVKKRKPLLVNYDSKQFFTNPAPSSGGLLIALALELIEASKAKLFNRDSVEFLSLLVEVMKQTNTARLDAHMNAKDKHLDETILHSSFLDVYKNQVFQRAKSLRGTTHISVIDRNGSMASMTVSNGEGCGHIIPGTGVMLNNMLGEEDLNPGGFHRWKTDQRMTSMMAPSLLLDNIGDGIAIGSGGSNRIRTAILQVLLNSCEFNMELEEAVHYPRIHFENDSLNIENGYRPEVTEQLKKEVGKVKIWQDLNLFFGGVHAVQKHGESYHGVGDPRRGGVAQIV